MSVKTPVFKWDVPVLGEEADVPADLLALATEIENVVKALEAKFLKTAGVGDAGKLIIVDGTGAAAFQAMSGAITITAGGITGVGNEKIETAQIKQLAVTALRLAAEAVETAKIQNLAVTEPKLGALAVSEAKLAALAVSAAKLANLAVETGKIANLAVTAEKLGELAVSTIKIANLAVTTGKLAEEAVTEAKQADGSTSSRKFKPTAGVKRCSADLVMTEAYQDIAFTGGNLAITPAVASTLLIWAQFSFGSHTGDTEEFRILMDAEERESVKFIEVLEGVNRGNMPLFDAIPLTAAAHTIKMQARQVPVHGDSLFKDATRFTYMLVAA